MKQQLLDFGLKMQQIPIKCDNTSAINLTKNPILHSRTKHIFCISKFVVFNHVFLHTIFE
jgi:hypothetical protein